MVVQHNLQAMNANRMLNVTTGNQSKSTEKLSSGYKINRAADDAAGLSISEKMRKQIRGLDQASSNAQDGVSAVQTAEGALTEVHSMLQRMNELAVQAANGTNSESDRGSIQDEINQLTKEIDRVAETTKFNEIYLLKGDAEGATTTRVLSAHDAGLAGELKDNGNGTSMFTAKAFGIGDKVTIAGKEYTIGKSADSADYIKKADVTGASAPTAVGDSVTSNGITTSIVNKTTVAAGNAGTWQDNDVIIDKNGIQWTMASGSDTTADAVAAAAGSGTKKTAAEMKALLEDGAVIKTNATNTAMNGTSVVAELSNNEVSVSDATAITAMKNGVKAGDVVTVGGVSKTVTAETPKTSAEIRDLVHAGTAGTTVLKAGSFSGKLGLVTDKTAGTITEDDFMNLIKDGDKVTVDGDVYTAIVKASDDDSITAEEAYKLMAKELEAASSIGADSKAVVTNNNNGTFSIKQGQVEVKDALSFGLHVGADADMTNKINVDIEAMSAAGLGVKGINVKDNSGMAATYAIDAIADAVAKVSAQRSALGAVQNRLEHTIANVDNVVENSTSAESRIRDTDMAEEMVNYSKNNILAQAGQSMLAQANQSNQGVLSLLG